MHRVRIEHSLSTGATVILADLASALTERKDRNSSRNDVKLTVRPLCVGVEQIVKDYRQGRIRA